MYRHSVFVRLFLAAMSAAAILCTPSSSFAASAGDGGTESALLITGILTIVLVAIALLALMLPEADLTRIGETVARSRRYFISGTTETVDTFDHDFDGITELDNRIPPWFSTLFLATIVFAGGYMIDYHVVHSSPLSAEEYRQEMAEADLQRRIATAGQGSIDEAQLVPLTDATSLEHGSQEFAKYCVSCHGINAQGLVGPNLTDGYWIHGGSIRDIYTTIKQGVPAKGMISWQLVFSPKEIQEIASYLLSLQGTNPPGAKKPEGVLVVSQEPATP